MPFPDYRWAPARRSVRRPSSRAKPLLIDDGKGALRIESVTKESAEAGVETDGVLKDKKGVTCRTPCCPSRP